MTWSINKGDLLTIDNLLIGTDFLSDTTVFATRDIGMTNTVDQGRLTVVDMAHDGNHWGSGIIVRILVKNVSLGEIIDSTTGFLLEIEVVVNADFSD